MGGDRVLLERGVSAHDGVSTEALTAFVRQPGLRATRTRLADIDAELATLREFLSRWPTDDTVHPYRYVGPRHAQFGADGRYVQVGEVLMLDAEHAAAWAERFETVLPESAAAS